MKYEALNGTRMTLASEGRPDTLTAPLPEEELLAFPGGTELVFDFQTLGYASSVGRRGLGTAQKRMREQGLMKLIFVSDMIKEIFEVTGFSEILTVVTVV